MMEFKKLGHHVSRKCDVEKLKGKRISISLNKLLDTCEKAKAR